MPTYRAEGIILKRTNYGEADKILTVLTRTRGKQKIIAKGIRRIHSRRAGNVELFNQTVMFLAVGRTFKVLTEAKTVRSFPRLRTDLTKSAIAFYFAELVDRFVPEEQESHAIFELLLKFLTSLEADVANPVRLVEEFEERLLAMSGFAASSPRSGVRNLFAIERIVGRRLRSRKFLENVLRGTVGFSGG